VTALDNTLTQSNNVAYNMTVDIRVSDIDQKTSYSNIEILIRLGPLPFNFSDAGILVEILGGGSMAVSCHYVSSDSYGKYFEGNSSSSWYFIGAGELFPFDYYGMEFYINPRIDANFTINQVFPLFLGSKQKVLMDTWETVGLYNEIPYDISKSNEPGLILIIKRRWVIPFLEFVLPIILCYFFLGATLFMNPKSRMQEIVTVYLSLFIFIPTFFIAIQEFLPYKSILSIPEILLTNLITTIGLFGTSIMISEHQRAIVVKKFEIPVEWFSLLCAPILFLAYYHYLLLPVLRRFLSIESVITVLLVILGYFVSFIGFSLRWKKYRREKTKKEEHFWESFERAHH